METKTLSSAIKKVAISYILIYLHINISVIDILPDWLGYFLIVSVLPVLSQKGGIRPDVVRNEVVRRMRETNHRQGDLYLQ